MGSAVTVGSGVPLNTLYTASKSVGKIIVGGTAANVVAAGGYVQGAGHSAFSPIFGLAADNVLGRYESFFVVLRTWMPTDAKEFQVVLANGELITVNKFERPDRERAINDTFWPVMLTTVFQCFGQCVEVVLEVGV